MTTEAVPTEQVLLRAITSVLSQYLTETDPYILFNGLLDPLLHLTESEYGFIGEVFFSSDRQPFVKSYATTNIAWSKQTRQLFEENHKKGMVFSRLDSLYGAVLKTGQLVIANQPATDPRSCGLPKGHPPLKAFLGIPFYGGGELLGMVGIANRKTGYSPELAEALRPFLMTCGSLIEAYRSNVKHEQVEKELTRYKARLQVLESAIPLGNGYQYTRNPTLLRRDGEAILLTRKELKLLELLISHRNAPVSHDQILNHVWSDVIVGEASIRSLVRRLRLKLPELKIITVSGIGYLLETSA
jgi:GAF domain-containing protein